ncbi:MAG: hypothetical protein WCA10_14740 [Terracidiphilus sp.]
MNTPESMKAELAAWNNGAGIDLESWIGCEGRFSLAVGYASIFWPTFTLIEGYILPQGVSEGSLRSWEQGGRSRQSIEWVMNHVHIADIHYGREDISIDKLLVIGNVLKEIYEAKLHWQFPDRPCSVELFIPDDPDDLTGYQLSFWQKSHETPE